MLRAGLDRFFGALARLVLGIFFRRIEVVGRDRVPRGVPLVVVANHVNGLIDPVFVVGPLGIRARVLGKSTLWKIPALAQLLDLAGVIPIHRPRDAAHGADPARNAEAFARCHEALARGEAIAIFPEGISHDQPQLQPLRTGAARIVIGAELARGPLGVRLLPVGLVFEERSRFRSRVLVVVGEPIDPAPEVERARSDEPGAVRALTARIAAALEHVTLNYETWEEARLVDLGADVWDREPEASGRARRLAAEFALRRDLSAGLERLRAAHPEAVAGAVAAARDYERLLRTTGLSDEQVAAQVGLRPALAFVGRSLVRLLVASPVAAIGTALNLLPWLAVDLVWRRFRDEPNQIATYKVFPALAIYPAAWLAATWAAGHWLGGRAAVATFVVAPLAGWVALRWHERRAALWRESRAFLLLRGRRRVAAELRARRAAVARELGRLVELWRGTQEPSRDSSRS